MKPILILLALSTLATRAQSTISPTDRHAYGANFGWINFRPSAADGLVVNETTLSGRAWSANAGWVKLDTAPAVLRTTSINITDTDNDGLGDAWEMQHFGNLTAANATTNADADPATDLDEYRAGTAPSDPASWLQVTSQALAPPGNSLTLRFTTAPARLYRIGSSTDLQTWTAAGDAFAPDAGPVTERTIPIPASARRFFKVTALRPLP